MCRSARKRLEQRLNQDRSVHESKQRRLRDPRRVDALVQSEIDPINLAAIGPKPSGMFF